LWISSPEVPSKSRYKPEFSDKLEILPMLLRWLQTQEVSSDSFQFPDSIVTQVVAKNTVFNLDQELLL
jgi:hypothetical protein